jgi:hypothetical protein
MENGFDNEKLPQGLLLPASQPRFKIRTFILIFSFFSAVPIFVVFLVLFSLSLRYAESGLVARQAHSPRFQALPSEGTTSSISVEDHDARIKSLDEFFSEYDSPLEGYAQLIIDEADNHNIDYRLLPAIAMQESTLCKKIIKNSHNCWGFGIHGGKVTTFDSYDQAIKTITATLAKKYVHIGFDTPDEIVQKYTPSDTGRWPEVVGMIMGRLKDKI